MTIQFLLPDGTRQLVTYTWNGLKDSDLEITETVSGTFIYKNERSGYILARYIGVGKSLNEKKIVEKVTSDMKKKRYTVL